MQVPARFEAQANGTHQEAAQGSKFIFIMIGISEVESSI